MVKAILSLDELPQPSHAADALAVAICHALAPPLRGWWPGDRAAPRARSSSKTARAGSSLDVGGVGYLVAAHPERARPRRATAS